MNKLVMEALKNILVCMPCKVTKVSENSLVQVQPQIYNEIALPLINNVPIQHLGSEDINIKFKVNVGDFGLVFFSQFDLSEFMQKGSVVQAETDEIFNLTNAVYCPFVQWTNGGVTSSIADIEITAPLIKIKGDIELDGGITATKDIVTVSDIKAGSVSLKQHKHMVIAVGIDTAIPN